MTPVFETTFDSAAEEYERTRPAYPPEIFKDILRYQPLTAASRVLEIGMGTGLATGPFLASGCRLVGLEPGENLAKIAAAKYGGRSNFTVCVQRLQEYACPDECFDLVYAATAFHWLPEEYGYRRVFGLLKKGGAFARFRYHAGADKTRPSLAEEIRTIYRACMEREGPAAFQAADARAVAELAGKYGFAELTYSLYRTAKDFTADEYMSLLRTYPDHMRLPQDRKDRLFEGIHRAIIRHGGRITVEYTMDLELARKPFS